MRIERLGRLADCRGVTDVLASVRERVIHRMLARCRDCMDRVERGVRGCLAYRLCASCRGRAGVLCSVLLLFSGGVLRAQELATGGSSSEPGRESRFGSARAIETVSVLPDSARTEITNDDGSLLRTPDLLYAGIFLGSLVFIETLEGLDQGVAERLTSDDGSGFDHAVAETGNVLGAGYVDYGLAGITLLVGKVIGDSKVGRIGLRSLETLAIADGLTTLFKVGVGRARPNATTNSDSFDSFSLGSANNSFPSGHTAHLFGLAGTLHRELKDTPWVPILVYPLATATAVGRVVGRQHWVTDVVAGAALGLFSSKVVGRLNAGSVDAIVAPVEGGGVAVGLNISLP